MKRSLRARQLDTLDTDRLVRLEMPDNLRRYSHGELPPMQTLVAFETAARHLSFTRASEELNLTQSAVSQQVKLLEQRLGLDLFIRKNNRLVLTAGGQALAKDVEMVLDHLCNSVHALVSGENRVSVALSLLPSFASTWFASRIGDFSRNNPNVDLIVVASVALAELGRGATDIAIRWGPGGTQGVYEERLFGEQFMLVGAASLPKELRETRDISDLSGLPFQHDTAQNDWRVLIEENGGVPEDFEHGHYFSDASTTLQAIIATGGIGVVRNVIARHLIDRGDLVVLPFKPRKGPFAYHFLCAQESFDDPAITGILDWFRHHARRP
ncbi:LysR family transcriptional regulator, glycine cleavage system transcriptional activator [Paracoccus isoporae]|uniref:LysR family transcriptional regulator, glycine cleavage system transcriptional activator n=1 Tax=Paracoccus isoporae TaxID=591205 RepID=A0A1G7H0U8_9RHOB|nr:LysR substrate-binding domain-containing protein [Paracoccus isoporae]SDE94060.1 LysR family transcriptional regulator, glycine cleavage system transcriptional activator [Paracoccus isoporae]